MSGQDAFFRHFPRIALEVSGAGLIRSSNGKLEALIGRELVGTAMEEALDGSSRDKWRRILTEPAPQHAERHWELVFETARSLVTKPFSAIRGSGEEEDRIWLLEAAPNREMERLYGELAELHGDLVEAQRELRRERSILADALERAETAIRTRDEVLAVVSHDLRSPLGTISMAAGALEMLGPAEWGERQIAIIQRTARRMNRLIDDLLDASALESDRFTLDKEPLAVRSVVREAYRMFDARATQSGLHLQLDLPEEVPDILADRDRILRVLANLLGNALKFTPEAGSIILRVRPFSDEVAISVEDNGVGISEADLPHVFDRFWHASRRDHGGSGLGLAIAKGIVEAHGGQIRVESSLGQGTTFTFSVPVAPAN